MNGLSDEQKQSMELVEKMENLAELIEAKGKDLANSVRGYPKKWVDDEELLLDIASMSGLIVQVMSFYNDLKV